jgi:hypothetical protein
MNVTEIKTRCTKEYIEAFRTKEAEKRKELTTNNKPHPTQTLTIKDKNIEVDTDMIPIVLWLNSLEGVKTLFCCQGDINPLNNGLPPIHVPYVLWNCNNQETLKYVLQTFEDIFGYSPHNNIRFHYHTVTTRIDLWENQFRYYTHWFDNLALQEFTQKLTEISPELSQHAHNQQQMCEA